MIIFKIIVICLLLIVCYLLNKINQFQKEKYVEKNELNKSEENIKSLKWRMKRAIEILEIE